MKRNTLFNLLTVLGLVLALGGSTVTARQAQAQGTGPLGPQDAVGTAFTYQGRLEDGSGPVDGNCDFRFNLYDDAWPSPSLVAGPVDRGNVTVSDGYFSTAIDFGVSAFTGEGRQLEIAVRCPAGSGSYTTLSGMVTLNAAPYAHSLRPGAVVNGSVELGSVVKAENTYSGMFASYGLQGVSQDTGVLGTGGATGVEGETASTDGKGVYGEATASSGTNYGVYGKTNSVDGYGVYGESPSAGGRGVYGYSASGHGVHGKANPPDGYGIYSEGNAYVEGKLFWSTLTSAISIPPAAFTPSDEGYGFANDGHMLTIGTETPNVQHWLAPVQLPQGAIVTKFTFYWTNHSASVNGSATLYRTDLAGGEEEMATASTSVSTGPTSSVDSSIDYSAVDNTQYNYYIWLLLRQEGGAVELHGVTIEYTITQPY